MNRFKNITFVWNEGIKAVLNKSILRGPLGVCTVIEIVFKPLIGMTESPVYRKLSLEAGVKLWNFVRSLQT